jgi:thiol-disulfide isomerase/thioredoxin
MRSLTTLAAFIALGASAWADSPVPRPEKEFKFVLPSGQSTLLSGLKGKVVIVQGLLVTCPHCKAMSALLTKLQNEYGPRGFRAMGIAYDVDAAAAQSYVTENHVGFPVGYASEDVFKSFFAHSVLERWSFPQEMIIDRKGMVQAESAVDGTAELQQEANLRVWIEKLLGPAPVSATKKAAPTTASTTK